MLIDLILSMLAGRMQGEIRHHYHRLFWSCWYVIEQVWWDLELNVFHSMTHYPVIWIFVGPAEALFKSSFYKYLYDALRPGGKVQQILWFHLQEWMNLCSYPINRLVHKLKACGFTWIWLNSWLKSESWFFFFGFVFVFVVCWRPFQATWTKAHFHHCHGHLQFSRSLWNCGICHDSNPNLSLWPNWYDMSMNAGINHRNLRSCLLLVVDLFV